MAAPATVTAIGAGHSVKLGMHEMLNTGAAMAAFAENPYLVNKI